MKHILVATDGSETANRAVDLAAEMAARFGVPMTVGNVLQFDRSVDELGRMAEVEHLVENVRRAAPPNFGLMSGSMGDLLGDTRPRDERVRVITMLGDEVLRRAADAAREKGAKTVQTRSAQGDPADSILDMAAEVDADLIVLGHRGLGRLKTLLLGSVALKVMQHAECSVLSVR